MTLVQEAEEFAQAAQDVVMLTQHVDSLETRLRDQKNQLALAEERLKAKRTALLLSAQYQYRDEHASAQGDGAGE